MKKLIKIIVPIVIIISLVLIFLVIKKDDKFKDLGYSQEQIKIINKLDNSNIILEYKYNTKIIDIVSNKDFNEKNIKEYIDFSSKSDLSINDIIYIINNNYYKDNVEYDENILKLIKNENFKLDNFDKYIELYNKYSNIDNVLYLVNNNLYDSSIEYNDDIVNLTKEKYYIHSNLNRYIEYKKNHNLDNYNIVLNVNCNLDSNFYTNTSPTDLSKGDLILVNKYFYLAKDYVPDNLVQINSKYGVSQYLNSTVYNKYIEMWNDAYNAGLSLYINSPYRSYSTQSSLYNNYAARDGYIQADTYSAKAGFSEHQTGLAFDVTSKSTNFDTFAYSNEYDWLQDNAYKYGFILRYPKGKEYITGYQYESWHYRYVGIDVASKIKELGITFEEYYAYFVK